MHRGRCTNHIFLIDACPASCFTSQVYAYGMCCALGVGTIWLIITSKMGLNVSSTHSISECPFLSDFTYAELHWRLAYVSQRIFLGCD